MKSWVRYGCLAAGLAAGMAAEARAETDAEPPTVEELRDFSIEQLTQVEVTSASKRAEPLREVPAALYVITQDQILRSAGTSLPQILRQAPNLMVERIDARQFAISARGFNGYETANKLLAQIDGRSIYTTLFSGILWELHHPLVEDLQQIEVISGPGGTLYGPNAVNGVINITSKSAMDTVGGIARGSVAAGERTAAARYGVALGSSAAIRAYANWFDREGLPAGAAGDIDDDFSGYQLGFRMDAGAGRNAFTLQGDLFDTNTDIISGDGDSGENVLARWTSDLGNGSSFQLQGYYDRYRRQFALVTDALETFDLQAQYNGGFGSHRFVIGAGARTTKDLFDNNLNSFVLTPERKRLWIMNVFAQDTFALSPAVDLIAGVKLENSSFSGLEVLPNVRLAWQPNGKALFWSSVSRAVRTPSRIDRQLNSPPILAPAMDFRSEKVTAIEAGYRGQPGQNIAVSINFFYNLYDDVRSTELTGGALPFQLGNGLRGNTYGVEAWLTQQVAPWARLRAGVATLHKDFREKAGHDDLGDGVSLGSDPDYQASVRAELNLLPEMDLNLGLRAVDDLERADVDSYVEAGFRLGWRATAGLELYVAGTNLLHEAHDESGYPNSGQLVERSLTAGTRVRF